MRKSGPVSHSSLQMCPQHNAATARLRSETHYFKWLGRRNVGFSLRQAKHTGSAACSEHAT